MNSITMKMQIIYKMKYDLKSHCDFKNLLT